MNIYDIAQRCGVSIATVSRVLNNSDKVRPQTRERILEVMRQENYTPSALARGLSGGQGTMAGIVCQDIQNTFHAAAVGYLEQHLRQQGLHTLLRCIGPEAREEAQAMEELLGQSVNVLLLIGSACLPENVAALEAAAARVPVILFNAAADIPGVYSVAADERGAVCELTQTLFRRQRRQILLLHEGTGCQEMLAGYQEGHKQAGIPVDPQRLVAVSREPEAVNACMKQLLVQRVSFDAVIATADAIALGTQKALQRIGLTMPIIGFHNSLAARCSTPELTSVDTRVEELCTATVEVLQTVLAGQPANSKTMLPTRLVERDTFRAN